MLLSKRAGSTSVLSSSKNGSSYFSKFRKLLPLYLLLLPGIIYMIVYRYVPMAGLVMVFKDYKITRSILASPWVGLQNFKDLFNTYTFSMAFQNTVIISLMKMLIGFPAPIILALMLNEARGKYSKRVLQTAYYLPHFISWVVISSLVFTFFAPDSGSVTQVIQRFTGYQIDIMINPKTFRWLIAFSEVWKEVGWGSIIYLAALTGIDTTQYEAALIDGARKYQQLFYITIPGLIPTIMTMLILRCGEIMRAGFDQVFVMKNNLVWEVSEILETYSYSLAFQDGKFAMAATVGLFQSVIGLVLVLTTNAIARRYEQEVF